MSDEWVFEEEPDGAAYKLHTSPLYQGSVIIGSAAVADIRLSDFRDSRTPDEARAIARAIVAVPALIAACEAWDQGFVDGEVFDADQFLAWVNRNRRTAREALAKARGA